MPQAVIHQLEPVEIDIDQRNQILISFGLVECLFQPV